MLRRLLTSLVLLMPTVAVAANPNIVVIYADDLPYTAISAYGTGIGGLASTPSIDAIATAGVKFTGGFHTTPVCTPARVMLWTGQYPWKTQVWNNGDSLTDSIPTVMDSLVTDGYETYFVGKWQTAPLTGANLGWTHRDLCTESECEDYFDANFSADGAAAVNAVGYITTTITDKAIARMEARTPGVPFFVVLSHKAPHHPFQASRTPYEVDDGDLDAFTLTEPSSIGDTYVGRAAQIGLFNARLLGLFTTWSTAPFSTCPLSPSGYCKTAVPGSVDTDAERIAWVYQEYGKDILETTKSLDREVGRLLTYLATEVEGGGFLGDNTVVIFTSDNGLFVGEHSWESKLHISDASSRMALLMKGPGITAGQTKTEMVSNIDLAPTFLALAGVATPAVMDGRSLMDLLPGPPSPAWRTANYFHTFPTVGQVGTGNINHYALVTSAYKLIHFYYQGSGTAHAWELIDRAADPNELTNRYNDPSYSGIRDSLQAQLETLQDTLGISSQHNGWLSYTPP